MTKYCFNVRDFTKRGYEACFGIKLGNQDNGVPPFWAIFLFQLAWVLDFCLRVKCWEIQNIFDIEPRLDPATPPAFLNRTPLNS